MPKVYSERFNADAVALVGSGMSPFERSEVARGERCFEADW